MGRLLPEALYGNELVDEHHVRACITGDNPEPCDFIDYEGLWERVARRAAIIDPFGRKSYAFTKANGIKGLDLV